MIEVCISKRMIAEAKKLNAEMGALDNSITSGNGNIAGFIGESMVAEHSGAVRSNTFDYDLVLNGIKIDVKTKRTTAVPKPHYECSVADFNTKQDCDWYAFTRILNDYTKGWILGYLPKDEFYKLSKFHLQGEFDPNNNFVFKADCYNIRIDKLLPLPAPIGIY